MTLRERFALWLMPGVDEPRAVPREIDPRDSVTVTFTGQLNPIQTGATVQQMLDFDHASELSAIRGYNASIAVCVEAGDEITGRILRRILKDEGNHIGDIEARQTQIDQLGSLGLYLATQIGG